MFNAQREATKEWYIEWLKQNYPDWTKEQREGQAQRFALEQNPPPPAPPGETEEERVEREAAEQKLDGLRKLAYAYTANEMAGNPRGPVE